MLAYLGAIYLTEYSDVWLVELRSEHRRMTA